MNKVSLIIKLSNLVFRVASKIIQKGGISMSILGGFEIKIGRVPHGIAGDFIKGKKKVHFFIDDSDGIVLTATSDHVNGEVMREIFDYINDVVLERRLS